MTQDFRLPDWMTSGLNVDDSRGGLCPMPDSICGPGPCKCRSMMDIRVGQSYSPREQREIWLKRMDAAHGEAAVNAALRKGSR